MVSNRVLVLSAAFAALGCGQAQAQVLAPDDAAALRAQVALLKAQLTALEKRLDEASATAPAAAPAPAPPIVTLPPSAPATTIAWKGSPQFASAGRSFKAKGRFQADVGYVSHPDGLDDEGLGFLSEARRIRLGGEGGLGAGVGYKLELELSDNAVDLVDAFVTYQAGKWLLTAGNQNQFQALDEVIGDTSGSFMERAAFTDAFNFERRLGLSAQRPAGDWLFQTGVFTDDPTALSNASDGPAGGDENNSYSLAGRVVYAPVIDDLQLHFAASAHYRDQKRVADATVRYRQRPYLHASNTRLIGAPPLNVEHETNYGLEVAAADGPWHAIAEGGWLRSDLRAGPSPTFFGGYAEVGYYLTGEHRPYKDGAFGRAVPKKDIASGGTGAVQINLRYDYLDLNDAGVRGGTQNAYLAALIWTPIDNLRVNLNTGLIRYDGAPALIRGRDGYRVYVSGARLELDF